MILWLEGQLSSLAELLGLSPLFLAGLICGFLLGVLALQFWQGLMRLQRLFGQRGLLLLLVALLSLLGQQYWLLPLRQLFFGF